MRVVLGYSGVTTVPVSIERSTGAVQLTGQFVHGHGVDLVGQRVLVQLVAWLRMPKLRGGVSRDLGG